MTKSLFFCKLIKLLIWNLKTFSGSTKTSSIPWNGVECEIIVAKWIFDPFALLHWKFGLNWCQWPLRRAQKCTATAIRSLASMSWFAFGCQCTQVVIGNRKTRYTHTAVSKNIIIIIIWDIGMKCFHLHVISNVCSHIQSGDGSVKWLCVAGTGFHCVFGCHLHRTKFTLASLGCILL